MKKLVLLVVVLSLLLVSCGSDEIKKADKASGFEYSIVTVEGMPCMVVSSYTYYGHYVDSVTCDWSQWEGKGGG